jgi:hypothetical protein
MKANKDAKKKALLSIVAFMGKANAKKMKDSKSKKKEEKEETDEEC